MATNPNNHSSLFDMPSETGYTIYSKSGCTYCTKAKRLLDLEGIPYNMIDCDDYLIDNRVEFLAFIYDLTNGAKHNTFPMIFYQRQFIGGYAELLKHREHQTSFGSPTLKSNI